MIKLLKKLFHRHDFIWDDEFDVMLPGPPHFVCTRCGKKESL